MQSVWRRGGQRAKAKVAVDNSVTAALAGAYKKSKKLPDNYFEELVEDNTTHFSREELERLLASFKRVTSDRLQATHFYEVVEYEMGWSNLLLRKQLFKAFDLEGQGDITFTEFCEGYSTMLRGTVPELQEFAWRVYHIQGDGNLLTLTDMYTILRLALAGLEEVRTKQGTVAGGITEETRFPERSARQLLEAIFGDRQTPLTKQEFGRMVLRHRKLVDCIIPGFELIPQDPLHRAAEAGETEEVLHLLEVDQLDVNGEDAKSFPTTPLHLSARYGHVEVVSVLLENGANLRLLDTDGSSPLDVAVRYGRQKVVQELLRYGADVLVRNKDGSCSVHTAARFGQYKVLRDLLPLCEARVVDLKDKAGDTPLHFCAISDNWVCMEAFLEFGRMIHRDVDERGSKGHTPLATAVLSQAFRMCRRLLEMGAEPNATDLAGKSILLHACSVYGNESVVNLLLANPRLALDLPDDNGLTPIAAAIQTKDIRLVRSLLQAGASPNAVEAGSLYTPLHRAVLSNWMEGVDALLGPGVNCIITRDARGCTPLDYCRQKDIQELVHEYIESIEPTYHETHPVTFDFALVFYEGRWVTKLDGDRMGHKELKRRKVSKQVAAKRISHEMIDKESIKRQLRKAGLFVLEEKVLVQRRAFGVIKTDVEQYALMRVGAPLFRLQMEAQKMRLKLHHLDLDRVEDFYVDMSTYPDTGFEQFSKSERQSVILSILQSKTAADSGLVVPVNGLSAAGGGPITLQASSSQPFTAGISLALYKKYEVLHDFMVLHDPASKAEVIREWNLRQIFTRRFWGQGLYEFFSETKTDFKPLTCINEYFGPKIAFYLAYLSFYTNWLLGPAIAGVIVFGLEFIPSEYASMIANRPEDDIKFDEQYDHPMMFVYAFFMMTWLVFTVRGWYAKQSELAHRWRVETYSKIHSTANPMSTAAPRMQFVDGIWLYKPVNSKPEARRRMVAIWLTSLPALLAGVVVIAGVLALIIFLVQALDSNPDLHNNFGQINVSRNVTGALALYAIMTLNAIFVWLLNTAWGHIALSLTKDENHETIDEFEDHLAYKTLIFQCFNGYSTLFYFAYVVMDIDKTAATLAAIMVVGQLLNQLTEYLVPWILERSRRVRARDALLEGGKVGPEDEEEGGGRGLLSGGRKSVDNVPNLDVDDTPDAHGTRREITSHETYSAVDLSEMIVQFGHLALFGFTWPLAALAIFINNFIEIRLDIWKYCNYARRPMAQRARGLGKFWNVAFEVMAVAGIVNTCMILAFSTTTMAEYFFPGITGYQRALAAFATENFFLLIYAITRLAYLNTTPRWVEEAKKEPLRFIRDAHRAGYALRERFYKLMQAVDDPTRVTLAAVAATEGLDEDAAFRYLLLCRYIDSQTKEDRAKLLLDSTTTVPSLLTTVLLKKRNHIWVDPGEAPTPSSLLRAIMPVMDLKEAYKLGKLFREACYACWDYQQTASVLGSKAATIMYIRQFAAVEVDITLPQAERYCRLARFVDDMEGNPFDRLFDLAVEHPGGLVELLTIHGASLEGDEGEPAPSALAPFIEPTKEAKRAFRRADFIRRKMYELWMHDQYLQVDEMVDIVSEDMGLMSTQIRRYLLIKRYCDSLPEGKANEVLDMAGTDTLYLVSQVRLMISQGLWLDTGEPSFHSYTPPLVSDA